MSKHAYEQHQQFNSVTRFLHEQRYIQLTKVIKELHKEINEPVKIIDVGCGVCEAYRVLENQNIPIDYIGIDNDSDKILIAKKRYKNSNFKVLSGSIEQYFKLIREKHALIGLESFEHIPEPIVTRLIETIPESDLKKIFITVPNELGPIVAIKFLGMAILGKRRGPNYSVQDIINATFFRLDALGPHSVTHRGFDWRWLSHQLRQNCEIQQSIGMPFDIIPDHLSPSIAFVCEPRRAID